MTRRHFHLTRKEDVSGVSGVGVVAEGELFSNGEAVVHWLGEYSSIVIYRTLDDLIHVHGHQGRTTVEWEE